MTARERTAIKRWFFDALYSRNGERRSDLLHFPYLLTGLARLEATEKMAHPNTGLYSAGLLVRREVARVMRAALAEAHERLGRDGALEDCDAVAIVCLFGF